MATSDTEATVSIDGLTKSALDRATVNLCREVISVVQENPDMHIFDQLSSSNYISFVGNDGAFYVVESRLRIVPLERLQSFSEFPLNPNDFNVWDDKLN